MTNLVSGLGGSAGYGEITLPRGDDNALEVDLSGVLGPLLDISADDTLDFSQIWVNTNGFLRFDGPGGIFVFSGGGGTGSLPSI